MLKLALLFVVVAVTFDAVGAAIAKAFAINYGSFALLCILLFVAMGIYAGRTLRFRRALVAIAIGAIGEATLGWYVAALIGPARPASTTSALQIVGFGLMGATVDFLAGWIGVALGHRAARARTG